MAAPYRACIRSRSSSSWLRPIGLAFAAAHLLHGCALSGLHSQPLIFFMAASMPQLERFRHPGHDSDLVIPASRSGGGRDVPGDAATFELQSKTGLSARFA